MAEVNSNDDCPFHYRHARPNVAVDICSLGIIRGQVDSQNESIDNSSSRLVVFITRKEASEPWGLPGGFMHFSDIPGHQNETVGGDTLATALARVRCRKWDAYKNIAGKKIEGSIKYQVPVNDDILVQAPILDRLDRDPRGRVLSIPFVTFVGFVDSNTIPEDINHVAKWVPIFSDFDDGDYPLAFDHPYIIQSCYQTILTEARTRVIGRNLVNEKDFDLQELIDIYETLFNKRFEKSNFRKQFEQKNVIVSTTADSPLEEGKQRRIGERFRFNESVYDQYKNKRDFAFNPRSNSPRSKKEKM